MNKWNNVNRSLPDDNVLVLVYMPDTDRKYELCTYDYGEWRYSASCLLGENVTHWQNLPAAPFCRQDSALGKILDERDKKVLALHLQGYKQRQIADRLGIEYSAVFSSFGRLRKRGEV